MFLNAITKKQETNASARVVDGKLILSLPDALAPIVWQMDLEKAKASALEVRRLNDGAQHSLALKTPRGEEVEVATFEERSAAIEGLMAASHALETAQGKIRHYTPIAANVNTAAQGEEIALNQAANSQPASAKHKKNRIFITLGALAALFILFTIWASVVPQTIITSTSGGVQSATSTGQSTADPQSSAGVPISADDFLNAQ